MLNANRSAKAATINRALRPLGKRALVTDRKAAQTPRVARKAVIPAACEAKPKPATSRRLSYLHRTLSHP